MKKEYVHYTDITREILDTIVPGGVGLMTRVALLENLVYGGN